MRKSVIPVLAAMLVLTAVATVAWASHPAKATADLISFQEVPAISPPGAGPVAVGTFVGLFDSRQSPTKITYTLTFNSTAGVVTQSHIHIGQKGVNGGITIFLCSNLGNGPAGTQACPVNGSITGTITSANVLAVTPQGVAAGDFQSVLSAIKSGVAYVNVHSDKFPGGEIRGQLIYSGPKAGEGEDL